MSWTIWEEMRRMREELDNTLNKLFTRETGELPMLPRKSEPLTDIYETPEEVVVVTDIPGVSKDEVEVTTSEDTLTIKAESSEDKEVRKEDFYLRERGQISYVRKVPLPKKVKPKEVKAEYQNGTLTVKMPKQDKEEKTSVSIKVD